ncbi:DUF91 domain-containing protein [Halobacteriales archaeon QS_8_69_26]|nr:MAG: DUF91 domain-containing protein [Halobacteriales archaeon QS_8_69_26]
MTADAIDVLAGDCTVIEDEGGERRERRGRVVTVVKPDNTVLVHDATGYQPVAWLTRADAVTCARSPAERPEADERAADGGAGGFAIAARKGDHRLRVALHEGERFARYPVSTAGRPVGDCRDCGGRLVRSGGDVACVGCGASYGLPDGATIRGGQCPCGLPTLRVERGTAFELCLDRNCDHSETLDDAVRAAFDRAWDCPECGSDLRILRRGGIIAGCDRYPDCDTGFVVPGGTVDGECPCGLPAFAAGDGRRCLDATCEHDGR